MFLLYAHTTAYTLLVINEVSVTPSCIQYFARRFTELREILMFSGLLYNEGHR